MKTAVLLINLGSPATPDRVGVSRFLGEMLMDPFIIPIPSLLRSVLVHGWIVPRRAEHSARIYHKIWTPAGSPLVRNHLALREKIQQKLGRETEVIAAFRYGTPSIEEALLSIRTRAPGKLLVCPLYPQYSDSTTLSAEKETVRVAGSTFPETRIEFFKPFYRSQPLSDCFASRIRAIGPVDFHLFSFHSLPVSRAVPYAAQCEETAARIAETLRLDPSKTAISYQSQMSSRMGKSRWLGPSTHETLLRLARSGVKRVAVCCPSFVADCLETLEEIGLRERESFVSAGGGELVLVPSLNAEEDWVSGLTSLIAEHLRGKGAAHSGLPPSS